MKAWIGGWWIGFFVIGIPLILFGPLFRLFPSRLPGQNTDAARIEAEKAEEEWQPKTAKDWIAETWIVASRLLKNKV